LVRCTPFRLKKRPPARGQRWKSHWYLKLSRSNSLNLR
jgi:hypothetical protein